ncbi:MAG TPA: IPT/TIG domain-containing protein, partial [Actinomycetes bacterium]|nr:IPT/TIG domain-containing protein [Actinomycetes bacterium]
DFVATGSLSGHIGPLPDLASALSSLSNPAPSVSSFGPGFGPVGMFVTVTGQNFVGATKVTFNGLSAPFTIYSASTLVAVVPTEATDGAIRVLNTTGGTPSQTAFDVRPGKVVTMQDNVFSPSLVAISPGQTVAWNNRDSINHSVVESIGLGTGGAALFDSGLMGQSASFVVVRNAAGRYPYESAGDEPGPMSGTINVAVLASPTSGSTATAFTITWAAPSPSGYAYQVQRRFRTVGGSWSAWSNYRNQVTSLRASFVPDKGVGDYAFRSRLLNVNTGAKSLYSKQRVLQVR